ncbi:MAG: DUF222 domain-containing protein [Ilumatobacteraceae bacterium]
MNEAAVIERVREISAVRADSAADRSAIEVALRASSQLRSWLAAGDAALTARLATQVSFPEKTIADCTRSTVNEGVKTKERSDTLGAVPSFADALDDAAITAAHVDALTRAGKSLDDDAQRTELFDRVAGLVDVAAAATVEEFRRRLSLELRAVQRDDGMARLERQRRNTRLRTWVDNDGMWRFSGQFDPVTGVALAARLDAAVQAMFAESVPDTCPSDPIEKQHHLRALAFARLLSSDGDSEAGVGVRPGRPEFVVVIDASEGDGTGGPTVDWGIPVEVPGRVVASMAADADVHAVVVRNGVVIHAPGRLDLGRSTRLANRAQRRALRGFYRGCAIPGCSVPYDRCKLHHLIWWRHGGHTDLSNLLPLCAHHHSKVHDHQWVVELGPRRELTIRFPDGTIHNTGPPNRRAA